MICMKAPIRLVLPAMAVAVLALPTLAQTPEITGEIEARGAAIIPIAVPDDASATGEARAIAAEVVETVRWDLDFSGYFDVVDPKLYALVPDGDISRHEDWESIGADAVAEIRVTYRDDSIQADLRLHDTPSQRTLVHYRYAGGRDRLRRVAHQISDDLVKHYSGRAGIALTWITFVSKHGDGKELYLMDYDGKRVRRLTSYGTISLSPVWSPAGNILSFMSWRGKQPAIYMLDGDGTMTRAPSLASELNAAPEWSPDGSHIVYSADVAGNMELYRLDLAEGKNTRLTYGASIETAPAYSPNGREIAFTSDRAGSPQIYIMDAEGLNVRRVTFRGNYNDSAAWSPDGDRLAYVSRIEGRFDVHVLDLTTNRIRRLTFGEGNNENPRWSPDGRHLVFASDRRGTYDIYTMRSDGSDVTRLTTGGDCFTPDWSRWSQ